MAYSDKTINTYIRQGIIDGNGNLVKADIYKEVYYSGSVFRALSTMYNPIAELGSYNHWLTNAYDMLIFTPPVIIDNVVGVYYIKSSDTTAGAIELRDAQNNAVYSEPIDFILTPLNCHNANAGTPFPPQWDPPVGPVHICLMAYYNAPETINSLGFGFSAPISDDAKAYYTPLAGYRYFGDNCTDPDIQNWLDALLQGAYIDDEGGAPAGMPDGGGGTYDYPFDAISWGSLPQYSACDTGMVSIYSTTPSQMYQLGSKLWDNDFFNTIIKNFQSPMDNIISLHFVPFNVYGGTQKNIIIGNYDSEIPSNALSTTYFEFDCGTIELTGAYQTFADYAPYTEIALYLPAIGIVPISPDDIQDGALNVKYRIDVFSGACVAGLFIRKKGQWTLTNQYEGNILSQIPVTGSDYTNVFVGTMQTVAKIATTGFSMAAIPAAAGALGAVSSAKELGMAATGVSGAAGAASNAMQAKPTFQRSGNVSSASLLMACKYPYLIITMPKYIQATNFRETKGQVSNLQCTIGDESGFISASLDNTILNNITAATVEEKDLIKKLLAQGVYI